jgi:hypothetical protein
MLSRQACDAVERAQALLRDEDPARAKTLGAALDDAATAARELQRALPAPAAAGHSR